jgi:alpha-tubulin suppressor-like RCC1 family protein
MALLEPPITSRRSPQHAPSNAARRATAALVAVAAAASCADATPPDDAASVAAEPVAARGSKLITDNGLRENGLRENGLRENGLRENGLRENGLATLAFKTWFDKDRARSANVMKYVARCALRPDQSLAYTDGAGTSYTWPGSLGLAPNWNTAPATVADQEWVSACLMAFTNKCGNNVTISLRGPTDGAPETERFPLEAGEATGWTYQEGAFFGNLFDAAGPDANGCDGSGTNSFVQVGLGRECGSDTKNCGHKAQGACSAKCTISTNADKYYKSCAANRRTYARVITTYLDPTTWRGAMDCRNKDLEDNQISVGYYHVCARKGTGQLGCWGRNDEGQLGDGTRTNRYAPVAPSLTKVVQVSTAEKSTCARFEDGSTKCWGWNNNGQLGDGTNATSLVPKTVSSLTNTLFATSGRQHVCSVAYGGAMFCWGSNWAGQIGNGVATGAVWTPTRVSNLANVVETAGGETFSCARLADNTVQCWGQNYAGQLGDGTRTDHYTPAPVTGLTNVVQLAVSDDSACARQADGTVRCWGSGLDGQIGNGIAKDSLTPSTVINLGTDVTKVVTGYYHTCALKADGKVFCWGRNTIGQLGNASYNTVQASPLQVAGITDATDLATGHSTNCARRATGAIVCWGANDYGQLGLGTADANPHPTLTQVAGL